MPPYLRFPETQSIKQKFWSFGPYNPLCGLVSFEKGTRIFVWINLVVGALGTIGCAILLLAPILFRTNHLDGLTSSKDISRDRIPEREWIEKVYLHRSVGLVQSVLFLTFLAYLCYWFINWKLKKGIDERDLPVLKKYFLVLLFIVVVGSCPATLEQDLVWSKAFLVDIPLFLLEVMGLLFVHGFIASIIFESNPNDDMNRIQFQV